MAGPGGFLGVSGLGVAVSAESAGIAVDANVPVDSSKLSAAERSSIEGQRPVDPLLSWVPAEGVRLRGRGWVSRHRGPRRPADIPLRAEPGLGPSLRRLGLIGPDGLAKHLTGDLVVEASRESASRPVGGALLVRNRRRDRHAPDARTRRAAAAVVASPAAPLKEPNRQAPAGSGVDVVLHPRRRISRVLRLRPVVRWRSIVHDEGFDPGPRRSRSVASHRVCSPRMCGLGRDGDSGDLIVHLQVEAVLDAHAGGASITTSPDVPGRPLHAGPALGSLLAIDLSKIPLRRGRQLRNSSLASNLAPLRAARGRRIAAKWRLLPSDPSC